MTVALLSVVVYSDRYICTLAGQFCAHFPSHEALLVLSREYHEPVRVFLKAKKEYKLHELVKLAVFFLPGLSG